MAELKLDFPRKWVEFIDPEDDTNLYRCDLTWLTSRWTCIWGAGCKGIDKNNPDVGCCNLGAHIADKEDFDNTKKHAAMLRPDIWQNYEEGHSKRGMFEKDEDGEKKTRAYKGACIFHNRNGFEGGDGCALHILAMEMGVGHHITKPQVCWELPIRRTFENFERPDEVDTVIIGIEEYNRRGWGPGGSDLDWYCSTAVEAHVGKEPVYKSLEGELLSLMGKKAYKILVDHCQAHEEMIATVLKTGDKEKIKYLAIHPATVAANKKAEQKAADKK